MRRLFRRRASAQATPSVFDPDLAGLGPTSIEWYLATGAWASPTVAERVGTVARCLQLVAQQIATLPLRFRGGDQEPLWVSNPDPVWFPGGIGSAIFAAATSMYGYGDAFLWCTSRYATGYPQTFTVIDPRAVVVEADPRGGRLYRVRDSYVSPDDILQITRNPGGGLRGTSALEGYAPNVAAAMAAEVYAADTFNGGGVPWAVLQTSEPVDEEQAQAIKAQWARRTGGALPAVIGPDIAYKEFAFNPKDLMLIESREWDAKQIAAAYGVPAFMLNMEQAGGLNYSNPVQMFETWWKSELHPAVRRIDAHLSTWLPRGQWVEFDNADLLSPDIAAKQAVYSKAYADGAVTLNEYRAAVFDLPPVEEGDAVALIDEPPGAKTNDAPAPAAPPVLEVIAQ